MPSQRRDHAGRSCCFITHRLGAEGNALACRFYRAMSRASRRLVMRRSSITSFAAAHNALRFICFCWPLGITDGAREAAEAEEMLAARAIIFPLDRATTRI